MSLTNKILMIRPKTFRSNEQTIDDNFFQKKELKNTDKVFKQVINEFENFTKNLIKNDIDVKIFEGNELIENPDEIFPNNWIVFDDNKIGIFSMYAKNRRTEINYNYVSKLNIDNYKVFDYSNHAVKNLFLEGTGSVVLDRVNKKAYCCASERSSKKLFLKFCSDFEYKPVYFNAFHVVGNKKRQIYHTNVMMSIGDKLCVICLDSVDNINQKQNLIENISNSNTILEINEEQMNNFVGNIIFLKSKKNETQIVMSDCAFRSLKNKQLKTLEKTGNIIKSPIPKIEKYSGGSVRCMITEIF
tara:strand:- start:2204 stop:3106 length:903 start_codon:yes stop_codon:yes gene_type:complete